MTYGNFWDTEIWSIILMCAILLGGMLIANILKQTLKPLKESLIPASVLGGLILLAVSMAFKLITGEYMFNYPVFSSSEGLSGINKLEVLTYHCLAIGFIAMTLRQGKVKLDKKRKTDIFNTGVTTVATYLLQASLGMAVTIAAFFMMKKPPIKASGIILALGYGQGTGQALNYGSIYETQFGFAGGKSFGLTIAALGFLTASIVGIIYLNSLKRKGLIAKHPETSSPLSVTDIESANEIPMSSSVDKLTVQISFVFVIYAIAYGVMYLLGSLAGDGLKATVYGFNFLLGTLMAVIFKVFYKMLRNKNLIHREYINDFMMNRISGFAFDLMITAGIAAIQIDVIARYWLVLAVLGAVGALVTFVYLRIVTDNLFKEYAKEEFMGMFGMLTGTASTGVILLREIDPNFTSPVSENLVYQNLPAIIFGFPIMLLVSYAPTSDQATYITLAACAALFVVMNLILFRSKFRKRQIK